MKYFPIVAVVASLFLAGCDDSTSSVGGANVVIYGDVITTTEPGLFDRIYEGRVKNEGSYPAWDIHIWVTLYSDTATVLDYIEYQFGHNDTLHPGMSNGFYINTGHEDDTIYDDYFEVEWQD